MLKRWLSVGLMVLTLGLTGSVSLPADSDDNALATAPQGVTLQTRQAVLTPAPQADSHAQVVTAADGAQALRLTDGAHQFGAAWSPTADFRFDRNQTVGAWLYLGNQGSTAGNGLALVLQNDARGVAAQPQFHGQPVGETLGTWAVVSGTHQTPQQLSQTAIQYSWALGLNTAAGDRQPTAGDTNAFQTGYPADNVAAGLPGAASTYRQQPVTTAGAPHGGQSALATTLVHQGTLTAADQGNFLADGQWHHLTLRWHAQARTMTYTLNDRNATTDAAQAGQSRTVALSPQQVAAQASHRARWGFTATSGAQAAADLVVVDQTPQSVPIHVATTLTDLNQHTVVTAQTPVVSRDTLRLDYRITNPSGQSLAQTLGRLTLPQNIQYQRLELISATGKTTMLAKSALQNHHLAATLAQSLGRQQAVTLRLIGRATTVPTTQSVAPTISTITSPTTAVTATTPQFDVNPHLALRLAVTSPAPHALSSRHALTVRGKVTVTPASTTKLTVKPTLNGRALTPVVVGPQGQFSLRVAANQWRTGLNHLKLLATSATGDTAPAVTLPVTVRGGLRFAALKMSGFQATTLTGQNRLMPRNPGWRIIVQDTRGAGHHWTLLASATRFVNTQTGQPLAGQPVYVDGQGTTPLGARPTAIMTQTTHNTADGVTNVTGQWTDKTGVLLAVNGGTPAGTYRGSLTWTLSDAPE